MVKPLKQFTEPVPDIYATIDGIAQRPWATLRSGTKPLLAPEVLQTLKSRLGAIDNGLEITEQADGLALLAQPKDGVKRTRAQVTIAINRTANALRWRIRWTAN
jgi:hypothetical protein